MPYALHHMALTPEAYLRPDVIKQVERFDLKAKFLMEGFLAGLHSSPHKGFSVEFSEHRKYVHGDDYRTIDWKVWSRTNRYYIKQYEAETNLTGYLLVDGSGSMAYRGPTIKGVENASMSKLEYATCLAGAMAYLMSSQQDPVGLITFGTEIQTVLKPKSKASNLLSMLRVLAQLQPHGPTGLAKCLHQIAEYIPHRGLVMIFSDFLDDEPAMIDALAHLRYRGHDVIAFQIFSAAETLFPFTDTMRFEDIEGVEQAIVTAPAAIREGYLKELKNFLERMSTECRKRRIDWLNINTGMSFEKALMTYLMHRCSK